ncbi:hypothetical protein PVAP13_2KG216700 [Panicum virgatum]|nr:hypothetical protein PVAP13_2KG216700 [Panicum virgatum]
MSRSVVQLAVCKGDRMLPVHFGTGIILCYVPSPSCIAILTTVTCAENREKGEEDDEEKKKDDYKTFVKFGDFEEKRAFVFLKDSILTVLVAPMPGGYEKNIIPLDGESFYETNINKSEPVWVVGCFSKALEKVIPPGYVRIIGLNVASTGETARLNFALTFEEMKNELACLLDGKDDKKPMSSLVGMLRVKLLGFLDRLKPVKKKTDGASSSSATAN